jgi:tetratricopeptide (TPR) repeat protein
MDPFAIQTQENEVNRKISPGVVSPALSFFVWGGGQLYNGENRKASIFFTGQLVAFLYLWDYYTRYLVYQVMVSHLGDFLYSFLIFLFSFGVLFLWVYNIFDAHRMASFLEFISDKNPSEDEMDEVHGWDFEVDHRKKEKGFPWGSTFLYVLAVLVLVKYVITPGKSDLEVLVRRVQDRPGGVSQRLELAHYYAGHGKVRHAILEVEEFLTAYGKSLESREKMRLESFLESQRSEVHRSAFVTEKVLEQEDATDWLSLSESLVFEEFERRALAYLQSHKGHDLLVRILVTRYLDSENWGKAKSVVTAAMRARPHDPELVQSLARIEQELNQSKKNQRDNLARTGALSEAVTLYKQESFSESQSKIQNYFSLGGMAKEAYLLQNAILIKTKNYDEAVVVMRRALKVFPEDPSFHYFLGKAYFGKRDYSRASSHFLAAAERKQDDPEIFKNLGIAYKKLGDYPNAVAWYQKALRLKKDNPTLLFLLGYAELRKGDLKGALKTYRKLTRLYPKYPELDYYRALAEEQNGLLIGARKSLSLVRSSSPFFEQARQRISALDHKLERIRSSQSQLSHPVEPLRSLHLGGDKKPMSVRPAIHEPVLLEAAAETGDRVEPAAIESRIDKIANLLKKAETFFYRENWDKAREGYEKVLEMTPDHFYSLKQIGRIHLERGGDYDKAHDYLSRAEKIKPEDTWLNVALGVIAKANDQILDSIRYFEAAIEQDSSNLNANFNLALLYEDQNQLEKAKEYYLSVIAHHPQHQLAYNYLGDIYYNEGQFLKASRMYRRFLESSPENVGIRFKRALCLERVEDFDGAMSALNQLKGQVKGEKIMEQEINAVIQRIVSR